MHFSTFAVCYVSGKPQEAVYNVGRKGVIGWIIEAKDRWGGSQRMLSIVGAGAGFAGMQCCSCFGACVTLFTEEYFQREEILGPGDKTAAIGMLFRQQGIST